MGKGLVPEEAQADPEKWLKENKIPDEELRPRITPKHLFEEATMDCFKPGQWFEEDDPLNPFNLYKRPLTSGRSMFPNGRIPRSSSMASSCERCARIETQETFAQVAGL